MGNLGIDIVITISFMMALGYWQSHVFVGLAYQGKDIVFRFIIKFSSLRDFGS
jgi:hypothetical protein